MFWLKDRNISPNKRGAMQLVHQELYERSREEFKLVIKGNSLGEFDIIVVGNDREIKD